MNKMRITLPNGTIDISIAVPVLSLSTPTQRLMVAKQEVALRTEELYLCIDRLSAALKYALELTEAVKGGQQ